MPRLVIPGGSGFLGLELARFFSEKGWEVSILSRNKKADQGAIKFFQWDGKTLGDWVKQIDGADVLINMAGRTVNCRYNEKNKKQILDSRIDSTRVLGQAIANAAKPPSVWINSSSATIYEDTRGELPANDEYKGKIGTAIVIGKEKGGALEYLINLTKLWLGGTQGSGEQFVSWVHLRDFARVVAFLIEKEHIAGVVNCAAPHPVTNQNFMAALRKAVGRSWGLPMPKFLLEIGAILLRTQTELVLKSRKVVSKRLEEEGFLFEFNTVEEAFEEICK